MTSAATLPVRSDWFERTDLAGGITWLFEPSVHIFLRANMWHVRGREQDLLVDTGMGVASLRAAFPDLFAREPIVFVTHGHYDHTGSAHEFAQRFCHSDEAPMLAEPEEATLITAELSDSFNEALAADDPNGVVPEFLVDAVPNASYSLSDYDTVPAPVAEPLEDGALIELGDRSFEVIHLPGHTPGSAGLYERRTGVLFTGDVLYEGELLDELPESNIDDYVHSMRRLAALEVPVAY